MLTLEKIDDKNRYYDYVKGLYDSAFPDDEKRDFDELISGNLYESDFYLVKKGRQPVGFVSCLTFRDITHILYFAVEERYRHRGYGSEILALVKRHFSNDRIIADVEEPMADAPNLDEREKRIDFYLHNGYRFTDIRYEWQGERYIILSQNGYVSEDEFSEFWDYFSSKLP